MVQMPGRRLWAHFAVITPSHIKSVTGPQRTNKRILEYIPKFVHCCSRKCSFSASKCSVVYTCTPIMEYLDKHKLFYLLLQSWEKINYPLNLHSLEVSIIFRPTYNTRRALRHWEQQGTTTHNQSMNTCHQIKLVTIVKYSTLKSLCYNNYIEKIFR